MDKGFLKKVVDQIVRETEINDVEERVYPPNSNDTNSYSFPSIPFSSLFPPLFLLVVSSLLTSFIPILSLHSSIFIVEIYMD